MTLNFEQRAVYQLLIADYFSATVMKSRRYQQAIQHLFQLCWQWLETKTIRAEGIYHLLDDGTDFGGLFIYMQEESEAADSSVWDLIFIAGAMVAHLAYQYQGDKFLPGLIEGALLDEVFDYFDKELGRLVSTEVRFILENDFQNTLSSLQTYNRQELLLSLDLFLSQAKTKGTR